MSAPVQPGYLVDAESDPVVIRIQGRASFQNCACISEFFASCIREGKTRFVMDFKACTTMDSTFLGVLAGAAIKVRKLDHPGSLILANLGERNQELVCNLGLDRLLTIDEGGSPVVVPTGPGEALDCRIELSELDQARIVLKAHENLVEADQANLGKFQDVLTFLREQVKEP